MCERMKRRKGRKHSHTLKLAMALRLLYLTFDNKVYHNKHQSISHSIKKVLLPHFHNFIEHDGFKFILL